MLRKAGFKAVFSMLAALMWGGQAAYGAPLNFVIEKYPGLGGPFEPLYMVTGKGIQLEVKNSAFAGDPFAKYDLSGTMFGRKVAPGYSIKHEALGGRTGVQVDSPALYFRQYRQSGWPELHVETRSAGDMDPSGALVLVLLAEHLPRIDGAAHPPSGQPPSAAYSFRQFGEDTTLVEGAGLRNVTVKKMPWGGGSRYMVTGSGFGKNFDGADSLELETDPGYLGNGGMRVSGCGMRLEIREDGFGGGRLIVQGAVGDSVPLTLFTAALRQYLRR